MNKKLLFTACTFMLVTANFAFAQSATFPQGFVGTWYKTDEYNSDKMGQLAVKKITFTRTTIIDGNAVGGEDDPYILISTSGDSYRVYEKYSPLDIFTLTIRLVNGNLVITGWNDGTWYTESNYNNRVTINSYLGSGNAAYDSKNYDKAITEYTKVIQIDANNSGAYTNRGNSYLNKGDYDRAIADYNEAIRMNPNYALAYTNRGVAYRNKGDYDRAITDYNEAIRLNPNFALAYNNRGDIYRNKGDYDRAIGDISEAIRLEPTAGRYAIIGGLYFAKKDYDKAIANYTRATQLERSNVYAQGLEIVRQQGKSSATFPRGFVGTWKRDNFSNTLTFTTNTLKSSSQNFSWVLNGSSGDSYTHYVNYAPHSNSTVTIKLVNGNLVISGDSGDGDNNWNGTWKKR